MVEKIVKQLTAEHRQVSPTEAETLGLVDSTLEKTTLPNIDAADAADRDLLASAVQTITNCNDDLHQTSEIDAAKAALDAARAALATCRSEEAQLLAFQQGEEKKLTNFVAATSQGPTDLGCQLPPPTQLDETPDAMGDFMQASEQWYAEKGAELDTLDDNNKKAIAAHAAKKDECDTVKQPDFEAKYCSWSGLIIDKRNNYVSCRTTTKAALDKTFDDATVKSGHRKADFTAVNRVRCLLKVLIKDGTGDEVNAALDACLDEVISTDKFTIAKPDYPPRDEDAVAALGDLSGNEVDCKASA